MLLMIFFIYLFRFYDIRVFILFLFAPQNGLVKDNHGVLLPFSSGKKQGAATPDSRRPRRGQDPGLCHPRSAGSRAPVTTTLSQEVRCIGREARVLGPQLGTQCA